MLSSKELDQLQTSQNAQLTRLTKAAQREQDPTMLAYLAVKVRHVEENLGMIADIRKSRCCKLCGNPL